VQGGGVGCTHKALAARADRQHQHHNTHLLTPSSSTAASGGPRTTATQCCRGSCCRNARQAGCCWPSSSSCTACTASCCCCCCCCDADAGCSSACSGSRTSSRLTSNATPSPRALLWACLRCVCVDAKTLARVPATAGEGGGRLPQRWTRTARSTCLLTSLQLQMA
jgi:hypothetical protein